MKSLNRRQFLYLSAVSAGGVLLGASGCAQSSQPSPSASAVAGNAAALTPTIQPTAVPTMQSAPTATATSPTATSTLAPSAAVDSNQMLASNIAQSATRFLDSLDGNQRKKATYAFGDNERFRWHWTTPGGFPRNGLPLREMNGNQKAAALALLRTSVSEAGYQKALDIMSLQRNLGNDPELYYVTLFGMPSAKDSWGWRFEGHHLSRQFTVVSDQVCMTPFFLGSWPTRNDAGLRAMPREEDAALELINALQGHSRETAIFQANTLTQHVTQNRPKVSPLAPVGIRYGDLNDRQQTLALEIIQTYLGVLPANTAEPSFERIRQAGLEQIRFGWAGTLERRRPQYYRLQGPTFLLEFDNSRNGGTHVHSVWRDYAQDFGYHLL